MHNYSARRTGLALFLATSLVISTLPAQQLPQEPPAQVAPVPMKEALKLLVLAGEGEMNDLERRVMAPLVVEVRDQNDQPVEGAEVVFRFPPDGPGGQFAGGKYTQTVRTNVQGQAAATGWIANDKVGPFEIQATATFGNLMGQTTIPMSNVTRLVDDARKVKGDRPWWSTRKFKLAILAGAGAAAAGIFLAVRNGGSGSGRPTVTITPGPVVIGGR